ncbi:hypothetical protein CGRA01v4_12901 [Colletotrichum graminicola]|uniref:Uncharacterized protein n=1 Tax=Colletotrichum graminicola (strain M1.001 / M2 / FGSC 10212) TaxID=645133 RepID=E3QIZ9_COLGM|nr:uncharacterized protein GLRG_05981 [Colletotrichum graminicola M1.001]EFQ30837.1 hypothetical protein GLRG_05981 [Colletotrichum graminicola M1.001]WDK21611.1 hypothetical protein CGRA01v4_12901 [Colletotrichum graminicola]
MAFKRKRSESDLFTSFTSPARSDSSIESFDSPVSPSPMYPRAYVTPSHLPSRTMKRFRDNRPSENHIHQRTLNMLYSAQQQQPQHAISQARDADSEPSPVPAAARNMQKSLHSFWTIKSAPPPNPDPSSAPFVDRAALSPISCEDCGTGLGSSDGAADGMDIDDACSYGAGFEADHSCGACGRQVCSHCSITNLGAQRRCLQCVGRTPWGATTSASGLTTSSMRFF